MATIIGCLPTQSLAFLAVFVYVKHATQAIAFEWKPGFTVTMTTTTPTTISTTAATAAADADDADDDDDDRQQLSCYCCTDY